VRSWHEGVGFGLWMRLLNSPLLGLDYLPFSDELKVHLGG
jgi:hypothetical protein